MLIVGVGAVGFGIPINEFSFGNTLIGAGMTATAGGLIVIALGAVVAQLHRLTETLAESASARPGRAAAAFDAPGAGPLATGRPPFPPRQRSESAVPAPPPFAPAPGHEPGEEPGLPSAPTLRNPETPLAAMADEASLSPVQEGPAPGRSGADEQIAPAPEPTWQPQHPSPESRRRGTNFDAMWPSVRPRPEAPAPFPAPPAAEPAHEAGQAGSAAEPPAAPETAAQASDQAPRAVAILKSGVVDGMGYTLYVDGSIEAELPQGTLRFASINDLRSHLEKNT
jgi:hypothetical protein